LATSKDKTDANVRLADGKKVDVGALHTRRAALQARLDDLAAMFAEGAIDASQLRRGTSELRVQIAGVDSVLAEATRTSPVAKLLTEGPDNVEKHWAWSSPDLKGKIIDELMTVTVMPAPRGVKVFNPELIRIDWHDDE
jgi:site-specific DNA recombinase